MHSRDFFFDEAEDARMAKQNEENWKGIDRHIEQAFNEGSLPTNRKSDLLDFGCDTGGLLKLLKNRFPELIGSVHGVEPRDRARMEAERKTESSTPFSRQISEVPNKSCDIVVSHETLYLIGDLEEWTRQLKRILRPEGGAFISLGKHSENPHWQKWIARLRELYGHVSYVHNPMKILSLGNSWGFEMHCAKLHPHSTSFRYSPPQAGWGEFDSVRDTFDFYDQRLMFIYYPNR